MAEIFASDIAHKRNHKQGTFISSERGAFFVELDYYPWPYSRAASLLKSLSLIGWPKLGSLPKKLQHLSSLTALTLGI
ncbi:hypothetical protein LguiB_027383 [Lonicera macranthoides]